MVNKLALALAIVLGTAGSAMAATTIDFESTAVGEYSGLTFGDVSISFLAGAGTFEVQDQNPGPPVSGHVLISFFTNPGPGAFQATFAGGANTVSIGVNDYGEDDDEVHLRAYDSLDNLLDSAFFLIPPVLGSGATLTVSSSTPISRVEWNETGDFEGGVYWDNLSYSVGGLVPEPSTWAMMLLGFGALGSVLRSRRRSLATA